MPALAERILAWENMVSAWEKVRANKGAPGVDEVSVKRWARNWETNLTRLIHMVRTNTYKPSKIRRFWVRKKSGGYRQLSILTVSDRVLQRAVLQVIDDLFDRRFSPCSFGFREGLSLQDAVRCLLALREAGYLWILDADIENCFESLDHEFLVGEIQPVVQDPVVRRLIEAWLAAGRWRPREVEGDSPPRVGRRVGVPLGGVISPLLCNIYLNRLDHVLIERGFSIVRYADDFVVATRSEVEGRFAQQFVARCLEAMRLRLSPTKTRLTSFEDGFDFLGVHFQREDCSFIWKDKHIRVEGNYPAWLYNYLPAGYG